ncbi:MULTISPECIES: hypothetical protein [Pseudomonas]|uniref:hypothetical protein n=1 Tax=Pseudomonas glycinae TaxID=1785145 RepID=UPI0018D957DD|nr:hypothetical protein [Pseudomonas glycinae]MBH3404484.1 hypothetical protein [Pseudomonas glycinae]
MSEGITASELQLEIYRLKTSQADIFTGLSKAIASQMAVNVAVTQQLNGHGLLPPGDDRKEYFSAVRKALADLEALNNTLSNYFTDAKKDLANEKSALDERLNDVE